MTGAALGFLALAAFGVIATAVFARKDARELQRLKRERERREQFLASKSMRWVRRREV